MTERKFSKLNLTDGELETTVSAAADVPVKKKRLKKIVPLISEKKELSKIDKELKEIYKNGDGTMPNMGSFEKKPKKSFMKSFILLLLACGFLAAVAWAGFFVLPGNKDFSENDVVLQISGGEELTAGTLFSYQIHYQNDQKVSLNKVRLELRYPEGFIFKEASVNPDNEQQDTWDLGTLAGGAEGDLTVSGYLNGDLGTKESLRAFLDYSPSNFSSDFQKVAVTNSLLVTAPVDLSVDGPTQLTAGGQVDLNITLSKPELPQKNLQLVLEGDGIFNYTSSSVPTNAKNKNVWDIPELTDVWQLKLAGSFNGSDSSSTSVKFKLLSWPDEKRTGTPYVWAEKEFSPEVLQNNLVLSLVINGSVQDFAVAPSDVLNMSLVLKNVGSTLLKNIRPTLVIEAPAYNNKSILDWNNLQDAANGVVSGANINSDMRKGEIAWNSQNIPALSSLAPGQETRIDLSLPFKNNNTINLSQFNSYLINTWSEVAFSNDSEEKTISTNPLKITVNSDLGFESRQQSSENESNKTVYKINWILNNSFHDLKDVEISADWYGDLSWQADKLVVPAGEASFDAATKHLVWKIKTLPKDLDVAALQFAFVMNKINPSQTDLSSKVTIKATDTVTGAELVKVAEGLKLK